MDTKSFKNKLQNISKGKKYITNKLKTTYTVGCVFRNDDELSLLLRFHPTKTITNIDYLVLRHRPPFNDIALYYKQKDEDEEDDVSYVACIQNMFGKYDFDKVTLRFINHGLRTAVFDSDYRKQFFGSRSNICFHCQKETDMLHVDHYETPFVKIVDDFMSLNNRNIMDTEVVETSDGKISIVDEALKVDWVRYHDSVANYQISCTSCNMKKGCYKYPKKK